MKTPSDWLDDWDHGQMHSVFTLIRRVHSEAFIEGKMEGFEKSKEIVRKFQECGVENNASKHAELEIEACIRYQQELKIQQKFLGLVEHMFS